MNKSKGMRLGAMLAAMLLIVVAYAGTAAPDKEFKNFPKDLPERVLLGLNDSELQDKDIPDFGHEVFERLKKDPKVIDTKGKIPKYATDVERRNWLDKLDKIRTDIRKDMLPYIHPNGTVISSGFDWEGYIFIYFYENETVNTSHIDEIYRIIDRKAKMRGIQEVPVEFTLGSLPQLDVISPSRNGETAIAPQINKTPSVQYDGNFTEKSVSGFGLLGGMILVFCIWLFRRAQQR